MEYKHIEDLSIVDRAMLLLTIEDLHRSLDKSIVKSSSIEEYKKELEAKMFLIRNYNKKVIDSFKYRPK